MASPRADLAVLSALLDRASVGDTEAFSAFYDLTADSAYALARMSVTDADRAEEVVLDAYVRAWADADAHRTSGLSPLAWILRRVSHSSARLRVA